MGLLKSFFLGEERVSDSPTEVRPPEPPAKHSPARPHAGRQFTEEDRRKAKEARLANAAKRAAAANSRAEESHIKIDVEREVLRILKELQRHGITMDSLIVIVADSWRPHRRGRPLNWNQKKEIVREVLASVQKITEQIDLREKH